MRWYEINIPEKAYEKKSQVEVVHGGMMEDL